MDGKQTSGRLIKFLTYMVAVILVNIVGLTLFFRFDLTANKIYSISRASRSVVSTLSEPLTIKVFFTKNLPAPHNNTERYLQDLLAEYGNYANKYFNYRFYDVSAESGDISPDAKENQELAKNYGIFPVQIQAIEKDEVKFQKAYMGMVLIHGDLIERIPTITQTDGLEYRLTTAIQKLNNKVSALINLEDKIEVKLLLSSSLEQVAPLLKLEKLANLPERIKKVVSDLNAKIYGKLTFQHLDPSREPVLLSEVKKHKILNLQWPNLPDKNIEAGSGAIGLVMYHGTQSVSIPLLRVIRLPIIGTQYEMTDLDRMEEILESNIESLIDINEDIGVLADYGAVGISSAQPQNLMMQENMASASNLYDLLSQNYAVKQIKLKEETIPESIQCLIIAGPKETLSEYDLFQIDQHLMKGRSLAVFLDVFNEVMPQNQQGMRLSNQGPVYLPIESGLEKLLGHYGLRTGRSYVLDENCFKQKVPAQFGGGERPIYFAPLIQNKYITDDLAVIKDIKGMVAVKMSPLALVDERLKENDIKAFPLFSSSEKSWEMKGRINLNPMFINPPQSKEDMTSFPLAYLLEGAFTSYFKGKSLPEREAPAEPEKENGADQADAAAKKDEQDPALAKIKSQAAFIAEGKPGKIFLVGSSGMIMNNVINKDGRSPNDMFVLNLLDYLNDRADIAIMRSKEQRFNPLDEVGGATKTFVKSFNIMGLPVIVVVFGLLVWFRRRARKSRIELTFH
jgi:ABC-type uncharacterized transport system involved in gliding motility auxiliary subunit